MIGAVMIQVSPFGSGGSRSMREQPRRRVVCAGAEDEKSVVAVGGAVS
jgi:hypothetical protein